MASTYLTRTPSSAGNRKTWTWSAWIKRSSGLGNQQCLLACSSGSSVFHLVYFDGNDKLNHNYNTTYCLTERVFRDTNAWYHLVCAVDTTQSTASNRVKFYVNGVQETLSGNFPSQNADMTINNNVRHDISNGGANFNGQFYFDGSMSHIHFIDGTAYDASAFGSTDSVTGEWQINTSPSVTYGTNGFFILKDGNSVTDQSGNSNNFTVGGGTLTKTEDCASNLFVTLNSLNPDAVNNSPLSNGNTKFTNVGGDYYSRTGNIAVTSGKFYAEVKITQAGGSQVGIIDITKATGDSWYANAIERAYVYLENGYRYSNDSGGSWGANTYTTGDIIGVAMDLDNNKVYVSKNGVFQNSGDPTSGSTGTGAMYSITDGYDYTFVSTTLDGGTDPVHEWNFGNGYFGSTQISSAGTNASGNGIFEYDVPTGYTALSTKGLNL